MKIIDIYTEIGKLPLWGKEFGADDLLDNMTKNEVMGSVVCPSNALVDFEKANETVSELLLKSPKFLGILAVNTDYYEESCQQMRKYLVNPKFIAIKLISSGRITAETGDAVLNVQRRYGKPVFMDCYDEDSAMDLAFIAQSFPQMKFLMLGMGGENYRSAVSIARKNVNIYLETGGSLDPFKIKYACDNIGSHRLIYGSHTPYVESTVYRSLIENSGIESRDITDIYYNSAKRLFNWK